MTEHPEDVAHRVVEERGDEMTIRLEAVTWNRVVDGTVGLLQLAVWAGVIVMLSDMLLVSRGLRPPSRFADEHMPGWVQIALLVFLILWTLFGLRSLSSWVRLLLGKDVIVLTPRAIRVRRSVGPFATDRTYAPAEITSAAIGGRTRDVLISTGGRNVTIASLGTRADRRFIVETLQQRYSFKLASAVDAEGAPKGWELSRGTDGLVLRNTERGPVFIGCTAVVAATFWLLGVARLIVRWTRARREPFSYGDPTVSLQLGVGDFVMFALIVCTTVLVYWAARQTSESIRVRRNEMITRWKFGPFNRSTTITNATLQVEFHVTKQLGDVFTLYTIRNGASDRVFTRHDDASDVVKLGRLLARETGWDLEIAEQARHA